MISHCLILFLLLGNLTNIHAAAAAAAAAAASPTARDNSAPSNPHRNSVSSPAPRRSSVGSPTARRNSLYSPSGNRKSIDDENRNAQPLLSPSEDRFEGAPLRPRVVASDIEPTYFPDGSFSEHQLEEYAKIPALLEHIAAVNDHISPSFVYQMIQLGDEKVDPVTAEAHKRALKQVKPKLKSPSFFAVDPPAASLGSPADEKSGLVSSKLPITPIKVGQNKFVSSPMHAASHPPTDETKSSNTRSLDANASPRADLTSSLLQSAFPPLTPSKNPPSNAEAATPSAAAPAASPESSPATLTPPPRNEPQPSPTLSARSTHSPKYYADDTSLVIDMNQYNLVYAVGCQNTNGILAKPVLHGHASSEPLRAIHQASAAKIIQERASFVADPEALIEQLYPSYHQVARNQQARLAQIGQIYAARHRRGGPPSEAPHVLHKFPGYYTEGDVKLVLNGEPSYFQSGIPPFLEMISELGILSPENMVSAQNANIFLSHYLKNQAVCKASRIHTTPKVVRDATAFRLVIKTLDLENFFKVVAWKYQNFGRNPDRMLPVSFFPQYEWRFVSEDKIKQETVFQYVAKSGHPPPKLVSLICPANFGIFPKSNQQTDQDLWRNRIQCARGYQAGASKFIQNWVSSAKDPDDVCNLQDFFESNQICRSSCCCNCQTGIFQDVIAQSKYGSVDVYLRDHLLTSF